MGGPGISRGRSLLAGLDQEEEHVAGYLSRPGSATLEGRERKMAAGVVSATTKRLPYRERNSRYFPMKCVRDYVSQDRKIAPLLD